MPSTKGWESSLNLKYLKVLEASNKQNLDSWIVWKINPKSQKKLPQKDIEHKAINLKF